MKDVLLHNNTPLNVKTDLFGLEETLCSVGQRILKTNYSRKKNGNSLLGNNIKGDIKEVSVLQ